MANLHSPKSFLRGRNATNVVINTYLNRLNAKLYDKALAEREEWERTIKANRLAIRNPIRSYPQLHPTRGYRPHAF